MKSPEPRKIKFKVWNKESQLLARPDSMQFARGEAQTDRLIWLQYTGMVDREGEELYEMDIVLLNLQKFMIQWNASESGWYMYDLQTENVAMPCIPEKAMQCLRLCTYFQQLP